MNSETIRKIAEKYMEQGKVAFLDGASETQIAEFEDRNGIKLPEGYKAWLKFSDGGECFLPAGIQFYGVSRKPLIDVNNDNSLDGTNIVIGALAAGDPILCKSGSERIVIFDQETGRIEANEAYESFEAFLKDLYNILGTGV